MVGHIRHIRIFFEINFLCLKHWALDKQLQFQNELVRAVKYAKRDSLEIIQLKLASLSYLQLTVTQIGQWIIQKEDLPPLKEDHRHSIAELIKQAKENGECYDSRMMNPESQGSIHLHKIMYAETADW